MNPAKTRMLVVDDDPLVLNLFSGLLRDEGYEVAVAATGAEGLRVARDQRPEVVLLDVRLPDVNGFEVCRQIKSNPDLADVFVVFVSGEATDSSSKAQGLDTGADDYLAKPVETREFLARIRTIVRLQRATAALRASEQHHRRLLQILPDAVAVVDLQGRLTDLNPQAVAMLGHDHPDEALGKTVFDFSLPTDHERIRSDMAAALQTGALRETEHVLLTKGGGRVVVEVSATSLKDARGQPVGLVGVFRDITERKRSVAALQASEERFRQLTDNISEVFWMTDPAKNEMLYISPAYEQIWGQTCESLQTSPRKWLESVHPDDRQRVLEAATTKQVAGEYNEVYRIVRPDGSVRWIQDRAFPIRDKSGTIYRVVGTAEDITEQRTAEEALRKSEAHQGAILRSALDAVVTIDHDGRIIGFNRMAEKIFGCTAENANGREMVEVMVSMPLRKWFRWGLAHRFAADVGPMAGSRVEMTALRADGSEFPAEFTIVRVELEGPPRFTAFIRDITARKLAEQRLAAEHAVIRALAESASLEECSRRILQSVCECLGWEVGALWQVEPQGHHLHCVDLWGSASIQISGFLDSKRTKTYAPAEGLPGRVWSRRSSVWVPDVLKEPDFPRGPDAARSGLHAAFGFPVIRRGEVIGVVEFFSRQIRKPDKALLEMMTALGGQIGQFIARKQTEEALKSAEANYRGIFENALEGIFQATPEGRFLSANSTLARMLGYASPAELMAIITNIGRQLFVDPSARLTMAKRLKRDGHVRNFESQALRKDGSKIWTNINAHLVLDAQGKVLYFEGTSQDITERKRTEKQIATFSRLGYRLGAAVAPEQAAEIIVGVASELFNWDACFVRSYSKEEDKTLPVLTMDTVDGKQTPVKSPTDSLFPSPLMRHVMEQGALLLDPAVEAALPFKLIPFGDKDRRSASSMFVPIHSGRAVVGILSLQSYSPQAYSRGDLNILQSLADHCGDAFRRIKMGEELREAEARYRGIVENATEGIFQSTPEGRYRSVNPALARMLGYKSPGELISGITNIEQQTYVTPGQRTELKRLLETRGSVEGFEVERCRKDGTRIWISVSARTVRDPQGNVLYYEGTNQDITERKRAAEMLQQTQRLQQTILDNISDPVWLKDEQGRFLAGNHSLAKLLGKTLEHIVGKTVFDLTPLDAARFTADDLEVMKSRRTILFEDRLTDAQGSLRYFETVKSPLLDERGEVAGTVGIARDITARKTAEEELRQLPRRIIEAQEAERLRVARELHDGVNQVIASAKMRLLKVEAKAGGLNPAARKILARCSELLVHALEENRRIAHNLRPSDLDELGLAAACHNFCTEIRSHTHLVVACSVTRIARRLPREVELNLFRILQEALNNVEKHARAKTVHVRIVCQADLIVLKIRDDGRGFTSRPGKKKGRGKGTGIGLTNMRERAALLGGTCEVLSVPAKGTVVTVRVPCPPATQSPPVSTQHTA